MKYTNWSEIIGKTILDVKVYRLENDKYDQDIAWKCIIFNDGLLIEQFQDEWYGMPSLELISKINEDMPQELKDLIILHS